MCFRFLEAAFGGSDTGEESIESSSSIDSHTLDGVDLAALLAVFDLVRAYGKELVAFPALEEPCSGA